MANIKTLAVSTVNVTDNVFPGRATIPINTVPVTNNTANVFGGYGKGDILANDLNLIGTTGVPDVSQPIYRGLVGSVYVYSIGSPPGGGAIDIVIIGYT